MGEDRALPEPVDEPLHHLPHRGDLCNTLLSHCQRWSINPELITLEVTESAFVKDLGKSLEVLTRLRMHGFGLSIDDFGTGYSSMQQLALLPFTELKLDRSFVDRCYEDPSRLAIIESSIELARKLGLKSVAEGSKMRRPGNCWRSWGAINARASSPPVPCPARS